MRKLLSTLFAIATITTAGAAIAQASQPSQPTLGGAELTYAEGQGIDAPSHTNAFWYAGTGGWASE
jgi:hypothetical protein